MQKPMTLKASTNFVFCSTFQSFLLQSTYQMAVKIRLERCGCRNRPFYRIIAADSKSPRDGKLLQVLGFYDPLAGKEDNKKVSLKFDRVKYWLSVGAQPSDPVRNILFQAGLLSPPPMVVMGHKSGPRKTGPIDPMTSDA